MKEQSLKNLKSWKPGESGNLAGRPKGSKNLKTLYEEAFLEIGKALKLGKEPDEVKVALLVEGIKKALDGQFPFYKDTLDRLYGQAKEKVEDGIEININKEIADSINTLDEESRSKIIAVLEEDIRKQEETAKFKRNSVSTEESSV